MFQRTISNIILYVHLYDKIKQKPYFKKVGTLNINRKSISMTIPKKVTRTAVSFIISVTLLI